MDRGAASKIQPSKLVNPTGGVPCPASNRIIDKSAPYKHEDNAWQETSSFCDRANGNCNRNGGEHALIYGVQQIGNARRSHAWLSEDIPEAKVVEGAYEFAGFVRERQRVAPKEPLEGDHGRGHDRKPDK